MGKATLSWPSLPSSKNLERSTYRNGPTLPRPRLRNSWPQPTMTGSTSELLPSHDSSTSRAPYESVDSPSCTVAPSTEAADPATRKGNGHIARYALQELEKMKLVEK